MQEWRVYSVVGGEPIVFEDATLFAKHLHDLAPSAGVVVEHYEKVLRSRRTYGNMPNASHKPPMPGTYPTSETVMITHIRAKKGA